MGHQRAAFGILSQIFTPQMISQTTISRVIMLWYMRFDISVAMMSGFGSTLPREWLVAVVEHCDAQRANYPSDLELKIEYYACSLRLISLDMTNIYERGRRGELTGESFAEEYARTTKRLFEWKNSIEPAVTDPKYLVTDFGHRQPSEGDVFNPYKAGHLYRMPLFGMTIMRTEWDSVFIMHMSQDPTAPQKELSDRMRGYAMEICEIFATVEAWPEAPRGVLLPIQQAVGIAALYLPQEGGYLMWIRRKFAAIEKLG